MKKQFLEAYRVWQTYALGKAFPQVLTISQNGNHYDAIIQKIPYPIFEHLAFEDEPIVWQFIEEKYLDQYRRLICLRFEWSFLACWQIDFPGSDQLGDDIESSEFALPKAVLTQLEEWHTERDIGSKPWKEDDDFDYQASQVKGLEAAKQMKPYMDDDIYFEYNPFCEIKMVDGVVVELPIPSFIITICNWRAMLQALSASDQARVDALVAQGFDLNLVHPRLGKTITELIKT